MAWFKTIYTFFVAHYENIEIDDEPRECDISNGWIGYPVFGYFDSIDGLKFKADSETIEFGKG